MAGLDGVGVVSFERLLEAERALARIEGHPEREGPYRRINPFVLQCLRGKNVASDCRRSGKTITMMTFIAVTRPESPIGRGEAIIVLETLRFVPLYRRYWESCFTGHVPPRFRSMGQSFEGLSGVVFTDEVDPERRRRIPFNGHHLVDGGGVISLR